MNFILILFSAGRGQSSILAMIVERTIAINHSKHEIKYKVKVDSENDLENTWCKCENKINIQD